MASVQIAWAAPPAAVFSPQVPYELAQSEPRGMVADDFNRDGFPDLVVTCWGTDSGPGTVNVLLGNGAGNFSNASQFASGMHPWPVGKGDFNKDGKMDLAVGQGSSASSAVQIFIGNGNGSFTAGQNLLSGLFPISILSEDFNEDTRPDLAVANNFAGGITLFLQNTDGTFGLGQSILASVGLFATDLVAADFNGDHHVDLALSHYTGVSVYLGNGSGGFAYASNAGSYALNEAVAAGDLNGDGIPDIASVEVYGNRLLISQGVGNGTFLVATSYPVGSFLEDVSITDLNGDGHPDVLVASEDDNRVYVLLNTCDGTLLSPEPVSTGSGTMMVTSGDWNKDGLSDLAAPYRNMGDTPSVSIFMQQGTARARADLDFDGDVDHADVQLLAACRTSSKVPLVNPCCQQADLDHDNDVDLDDFALLQRCYRGPGVPVGPGCAPQ